MNDRLLSIDVEAEIFKLSMGRLRNRSQAPVALVRMAAASGASRVDLSLSRGRLRLEHDGRPPSNQAVKALRILLDRTRDDLVRHRALERLEELDMLDLLVAFSMGGKQVELELGPPVSMKMHVWHPRRAPEMAPSARPCGAAVLVSGFAASLGRDGARRPSVETGELADALRYAGFEAVVNGRRIGHGLHLEDVVIQTQFCEDDVLGVVGIPRRGLAAVTRILRHGVLHREAWDRPADGTVWEAVVEDPARLEKKTTVRVAHRNAIRLYELARQRYEQLEEGDQERIKQLLFRLADFGIGAKAVAGVRLFETVEGERVDAARLAQFALGRVLRAVGPGASLGRFQLTGPVLVLDDQERGFVERHLGLLVREPPRNVARSRFGKLTGWVERLRALGRRTGFE